MENFFPGQAEDAPFQIHIPRLHLNPMTNLHPLRQRLLVETRLQGGTLQSDEWCAVALGVGDEVLVPEGFACFVGLEEEVRGGDGCFADAGEDVDGLEDADCVGVELDAGADLDLVRIVTC